MALMGSCFSYPSRIPYICGQTVAPAFLESSNTHEASLYHDNTRLHILGLASCFFVEGDKQDVESDITTSYYPVMCKSNNTMKRSESDSSFVSVPEDGPIKDYRDYRVRKSSLIA